METIFSYLKSRLQSVCSESELRRIVFLVGKKLTGLSEVGILTENVVFSDVQHAELERIVDELSVNRPIQYVLGEAEFCGLRFAVDERVLIPRPETEELVDWVISAQPLAQKILDVGTGSGCISVSLASRMPSAEVTAYDVSADALALAAENAQRNRVAVDFAQIDILNPPTVSDVFDVIVSNPPYIMNAERSEMAARVLDFEPDLALFVPDDDPLIFYRAIAKFAQTHLSVGGSLFFEINRQFAAQISAMLSSEGFSAVEVRKDCFGNDRMIKSIWQ